MKSETMLLFLEWRLGRRRFLTPKLPGYDTIEVIENDIPRKKLVINEEQAQTSAHVLHAAQRKQHRRERGKSLAADPVSVPNGGRSVVHKYRGGAR